MGAKIDEKIYENLSLFFDEILMDFGSPRGGGTDAMSSNETRGGPLRNITGVGVGTPTSNLQLQPRTS